MVKNKPLRIVIDTNLWISFIISKQHESLDKLILSGKVRILFSAELIDELQTTITKPKLRKYFKSNSLDQLLEVFEPYTELITVKSSVSACRDIKDDFLLALSKDGTADFLLTGDKDLLELEQFFLTKVSTLSRFLQEMG